VDAARGTSTAAIASAFHETLASMVVAVAHAVGWSNVAVSGGCFQNRLLLERVIARLRVAGFTPYWPQRVPPNDGGIALGQIAAYARGLTGPPSRPPALTLRGQANLATPAASVTS